MTFKPGLLAFERRSYVQLRLCGSQWFRDNDTYDDSGLREAKSNQSFLTPTSEGSVHHVGMGMKHFPTQESDLQHFCPRSANKQLEVAFLLLDYEQT